MVVDEILGKFETRYFGAGHKNTEYYLLDGVNQGVTDAELVFIAKINQLNSWSEKNGQSMKPHLSTVDGLIFSVLVAESYLKSAYPEIETDDLYLSSFEIKAGVVPVEDLNRIPIVIESSHVEKSNQTFVTSILGMKVTIYLKLHNNCTKTTANEKLQYMSNHLKNIKHDLKNIELLSEKEMICDVTRSTDSQLDYFGINSQTSNTMSLVEWLIIFSQMSQVTAYNFDDVERKHSDTFWMRSVKAELDEPYYYSPEGVTVSGGINKTNIISKNNENWRTFNMSGATIDSKVKFSGKLAHKIPEKRTDRSI